MKNLTNLTFVFLALLLISCGSDDSAPDADVDELDAALLAPLVGNWTATSVTVSGCSDSNSNGTNSCDGLTFCLFVQITDEGQYSFTDNTDPNLSETTFGFLKSLTSSSFLLCEPGIFGEEETCSNTVSYSFDGSSSLTITYTDDDEPGCSFRATFSKDS